MQKATVRDFTIGTVILLLAIGITAVFDVVKNNRLDDKLDQVLDNWNDRQTTCDQGDRPRAGLMYAYDDAEGVWTRVTRKDVELPREVARALCEWAGWFDGLGRPGHLGGLSAMLAKACGKETP